MVTFEKNYIKCCFDIINTLIPYFYKTKIQFYKNMQIHTKVPQKKLLLQKISYNRKNTEGGWGVQNVNLLRNL
jgi:hypothetical protein